MVEELAAMSGWITELEAILKEKESRMSDSLEGLGKPPGGRLDNGHT